MISVKIIEGPVISKCQGKNYSLGYLRASQPLMLFMYSPFSQIPSSIIGCLGFKFILQSAGKEAHSLWYPLHFNFLRWKRDQIYILCFAGTSVSTVWPSRPLSICKFSQHHVRVNFPLGSTQYKIYIQDGTSRKWLFFPELLVSNHFFINLYQSTDSRRENLQ